MGSDDQIPSTSREKFPREASIEKLHLRKCLGFDFDFQILQNCAEESLSKATLEIELENKALTLDRYQFAPRYSLDQFQKDSEHLILTAPARDSLR